LVVVSMSLRLVTKDGWRRGSPSREGEGEWTCEEAVRDGGGALGGGGTSGVGVRRGDVEGRSG
jgi:hypothetical protein